MSRWLLDVFDIGFWIRRIASAHYMLFPGDKLPGYSVLVPIT